AGVERRHAFAVLYQVHVHRLLRESPADQPDAVTNSLERADARLHEPSAEVERPRHPAPCGAVLRREQSDLTGELGAVVVDVVVCDEAVLDREQVDAIELDAAADRLASRGRAAR